MGTLTLFAHLQGLNLRHHSRTPVGDSVYRLESDTICLEKMLLGGVLPLVFSTLTLIVMFGVLMSVNLVAQGTHETLLSDSPLSRSLAARFRERSCRALDLHPSLSLEVRCGSSTRTGVRPASSLPTS